MSKSSVNASPLGKKSREGTGLSQNDLGQNDWDGNGI